MEHALDLALLLALILVLVALFAPTKPNKRP